MFQIQLKNILLPLVLVSIAAPGVNFLGSFWVTARWVVIAAFALYVLFFSAATIRSSQPALTVAVIFYVGWCILTYGWTKVPDLSLMKLVALALVVFACFRGGYQWIAEHEPGDAMRVAGVKCLSDLLRGRRPRSGRYTTYWSRIFFAAVSERMSFEPSSIMEARASRKSFSISSSFVRP